MKETTVLLPHPKRGFLVLHRADDGTRTIETSAGGRKLTADDLDTVADYLRQEAREVRDEAAKGEAEWFT